MTRPHSVLPGPTLAGAVQRVHFSAIIWGAGLSVVAVSASVFIFFNNHFPAIFFLRV